MNDTSTHETAPNIRVVVIEPGGPVNVGSIARAMANFAFDDLVLVATTWTIPTGAARASRWAALASSPDAVSPTRSMRRWRAAAW
ncbi:MAG TPA: TrmH family RNA methyltransferase [Spirochaetota bacterium]|nr:TrmH family RNA methyltransferase [Spirochaetota bacterium]